MNLFLNNDLVDCFVAKNNCFVADLNLRDEQKQTIEKSCRNSHSTPDNKYSEADAIKLQERLYQLWQIVLSIDTKTRLPVTTFYQQRHVQFFVRLLLLWLRFCTNVNDCFGFIVYLQALVFSVANDFRDELWFQSVRYIFSLKNKFERKFLLHDEKRYTPQKPLALRSCFDWRWFHIRALLTSTKS